MRFESEPCGILSQQEGAEKSLASESLDLKKKIKQKKPAKILKEKKKNRVRHSVECFQENKLPQIF